MATKRMMDRIAQIKQRKIAKENESDLRNRNDVLTIYLDNTRYVSLMELWLPDKLHQLLEGHTNIGSRGKMNVVLMR